MSESEIKKPYMRSLITHSAVEKHWKDIVRHSGISKKMIKYRILTKGTRWPTSFAKIVLGIIRDLLI